MRAMSWEKILKPRRSLTSSDEAEQKLHSFFSQNDSNFCPEVVVFTELSQISIICTFALCLFLCELIIMIAAKLQL